MPWSYLVALKEYKSKAGWHRNVPELQIELQQRLYKTKSGLPVLRYFDAATMISYQVPSKAQELTYCRREEEPSECDDMIGVSPEQVSLPSSEYLTVGKSGVGERAGRGLFAAKDIPKYGALALDENAKSFHFTPGTWSVVESLNDWSEENEDNLPFMKSKISGPYRFAEGVCWVSSILNYFDSLLHFIFL